MLDGIGLKWSCIDKGSPVINAVNVNSEILVNPPFVAEAAWTFVSGAGTEPAVLTETIIGTVTVRGQFSVVLAINIQQYGCL
jgi:hypothetical protein